MQTIFCICTSGSLIVILWLFKCGHRWHDVFVDECVKCKHHFKWFINKIPITLQTELGTEQCVYQASKVDFECVVIKLFTSWPKLIVEWLEQTRMSFRQNSNIISHFGVTFDFTTVYEKKIPNDLPNLSQMKFIQLQKRSINESIVWDTATNATKFLSLSSQIRVISLLHRIACFNLKFDWLHFVNDTPTRLWYGSIVEMRNKLQSFETVDNFFSWPKINIIINCHIFERKKKLFTVAKVWNLFRISNIEPYQDRVPV